MGDVVQRCRRVLQQLSVRILKVMLHRVYERHDPASCTALDLVVVVDCNVPQCPAGCPQQLRGPVFAKAVDQVHENLDPASLPALHLVVVVGSEERQS